MSSPSTPTVGPLDPIDATPLPLRPGDLVAGRYEILRLLGSGGSAVVYAVRDRKIGDEIALKLLRNAARSEIDVERTRREAEFARGPASARLVRTFDLVETGDLVFLTMELVPGGSLRDLLHRGPLPLEDVIRLAAEILEALADLHALDVVHRDLKPGNLLLTADGHVKLSDFGIARRWTDEESRLTRTGLPVGTVDYLSPEQAAAEHVDPRSDLYSFGVVLFEMLTCRVPFEASSAVGSIVMRLHRRAEDVRRLRPDVPRWLAAVVARLLETKREDRCASAMAVLEDMRRKRVRLSWRTTRAAFAVLILVSVLGSGGWWITRHPRLHYVTDGKWGIRAVDGKGETVWTRPDTTATRTALVRRGGAEELVTVLAPDGALHSESSRTLSFLDPRTGTALREYPVPSPAAVWFPRIPDLFGVSQVLATDVDGDDYDEAVVSYAHNYWPSFTVVHDLRRDEVHPVFVASGHHRVEAVQDIDGDGIAELIIAGTANRQGWYIGVAAVRVRLGAPSNEMVGFTPDLDEVIRTGAVVWYALAPPGTLSPSSVAVDRGRRIIRFDYGTGRSFALTYDGFEPGSTALPVPERQAARERAYAHLRAAVRLTGSGLAEDAFAEADAARAEAERAGDAMLVEWCGRLKGVALIRARRFDAADALFTRLAANSPAASEIAWDAANAYHLGGELERALAWYRQNLGRDGQPGVGRLKYETIQGIVLALGEMNRWTEARTEIDRFESAYATQANPWNWFRLYIAWRTGGRPSSPYNPSEGIDVARYWPLEFALARNHDAAQVLRNIEGDRVRATETGALLLISKAEALRRLGRIDDALEAARDGFDLLRAERRTSVLARAHFDIAAQRLAVLAEAKGLADEAKEARAEAAAVRWHPNGIAR